MGRVHNLALEIRPAFYAPSFWSDFLAFTVTMWGGGGDTHTYIHLLYCKEDVCRCRNT